ncbi:MULTISPECIES: flavin reductase family protein [unclassified Leucobacter]|uniref:flavin reductase family protein n=1 Tax=unclassified Leucobacter TaxID=2621730 RepID=UPI000AC06700|nr:flavin reductase family protein [Leucobacter sp. Ag1]
MTDTAAQTETTDRFKNAFRLHPAGVALVSGVAPDGPVGLTLSSVASVSAEPPVLSFSVTRATGSAGGILSAPSFVVHFLTSGQREVAEAFARTGAPRFTDAQGWETLPTGEPYLPSAAVALRCVAREVHPVGPSNLILADVLEVLPGADGAAPLLYQDRRFLSWDSVVEL